MNDPIVDFAVACDPNIGNNERRLAYFRYEAVQWSDAVEFRHLLMLNIPKEYELAIQTELDRRHPKPPPHPFSLGSGATT